jgi:hypothetical protein
VANKLDKCLNYNDSITLSIGLTIAKNNRIFTISLLNNYHWFFCNHFPRSLAHSSTAVKYSSVPAKKNDGFVNLRFLVIGDRWAWRGWSERVREREREWVRDSSAIFIKKLREREEERIGQLIYKLSAPTLRYNSI